ncbi:IS3 family transposase [Chryseobacterium sp. ISL-6]|uniref:IS3 family transposase n=1 Tax=Chryseobacterium sp. ISL-6 TaxID=2819143 RepID=UPI001BEBFCA1|nr:IS3 family transposase [Chryseobacterium sp. ISL-6]MBT2623780.1 IS3 family transposase [Chryseobacterium sp. ISL-6]
MKMRNPKIGLSKLCWFFGITRQAYYQSFHREEFVGIEQELVLKEVIEIRKNHPRIGTRKLYIILEGFMLEHQIKIGRDALFDLLSEHQLLIRRRTRKITTTQSHHWLKKYPNLIKNFTPKAPNQLYVSDITYWKTEFGNTYISLITDAYSHKIVGHNLAETMEAIESVKALEIAISELENGKNLIHHSDRGTQYCSGKYVKLLQDYEIKISMTETGDPLDNAIAERVNGILKGEYLECYLVTNFQEAKELLDAVVILYNQERPHMSIGNLVPEKVHNQQLNKGERKWKNYYQKKESVNES